MKIDISKIQVTSYSNLRETMRTIDKMGLGIAIITDSTGRLEGVVTDGDIRRALLEGKTVDTEISEVMTSDPIYVKKGNPDELINKGQAEERLGYRKFLKVPVVNKSGRVVGLKSLSKSSLRTQRLVSTNRFLRSGPIKKVLVIGGAGYVGSVLVGKLLDRGYEVKILDSLIWGKEPLSNFLGNSDFELFTGDIRNLEDVTQAIQGVDAVIHLAALVGDPACGLDYESTFQINYLSTRVIAETCKHFQINRFVFASTCSVYGANQRELTEEAELNPVSSYARTKIKSEKTILELVDSNFSPCILRKATVYGYSPRMRFDLVVNLLTAKAVTEGEITIFGGSQWRPFIHVEDAAEAYISCLEAPIEKIRGQIFNLGSNDQNYQMIDIGKQVKEYVPEAQIKVTDNVEDDRSYSVKFDKIKEVLGFEAEHNLANGIEEIKSKLENGEIQDWQADIYSNYKSLKENEFIFH